MVQEGKEHIHELWDLPGGGWEDEESIIECVKREVLEETGFRIEVTGFLGVYKEKPIADHPETIVFIFTAEPVEKTEKAKEDDEILDVEFKSMEEIEELDLRHENRRAVLEKYMNQEPKSLDVLWNQLNLL